MSPKILRIDSSARTESSVSRQLTAQIVEKLGGDAVHRDLANSLPHVSAAWIGANFTPGEARTDDQKATLAISDELIAEVMAADVLVIGVPIYNFGVPAALKAWVDMICRAGLTFRYSESGPVGLLEGKRAVLAVASGGTEAGSEIDFATGYMRHVLGFVGISDVQIVAADRLMLDAKTSMAKAATQMEVLAA